MMIVTPWDTTINTDYVRQFVIRQNPQSMAPGREFVLFAEFGKGDESPICEGTHTRCRATLDEILVKMTFPGEYPHYIGT
jgi:hypothetical protein